MFMPHRLDRGTTGCLLVGFSPEASKACGIMRRGLPTTCMRRLMQAIENITPPPPPLSLVRNIRYRFNSSSSSRWIIGLFIYFCHVFFSFFFPACLKRPRSRLFGTLSLGRRKSYWTKKQPLDDIKTVTVGQKKCYCAIKQLLDDETAMGRQNSWGAIKQLLVDNKTVAGRQKKQLYSCRAV